MKHKYLVKIDDSVLPHSFTFDQLIDNGLLEAKTTIAAYNLVALVNSMCTLLVTPDTLSGVIVDDVKFGGLLALFARCVIGNGIGAHPSQKGHNTLAAAMIEAYEGDYTAQKETIKNIIYIVSEYYDDAYEYAYAELEANGYIDALIDALYDLKFNVDKFQKELDAENFDKEYRDLIGLIDAELTVVMMDIDALIALIEVADKLDAETYDALMDLCEILLLHVESIDDLAIALETIADDHTAKLVAGLKEIHAAIVAEVEDFKEQLKQGAIKFFVEEFPEIFDAFAKKLVASVAFYSHEAAKALYYWLYNNPETVIEFFITYGDEIVDFFAENGKYAIYVLGYIAQNYGEEIAYFVLDNADVILPALAEWYAIHGDLVWDLVAVYIETLLQYTEIDDMLIESITAAFDEISMLLGEIIDMVKSGMLSYEDLAEALRALERAIANLVATVNGAVTEQLEKLDSIIKDMLTKLENVVLGQLEILEQMIADLKDLSAAVKAQILTQIATLKSVLVNMHDYAVDYVLDLLAELELAIKTAIADLVADVKAQILYQLDVVKGLVWNFLNEVKNEILDRIAAFEAAVMAALKNASAAIKAHVVEELNILKDMLINFGEYTLEQIEVQLARLGEALKAAGIEAGKYVYAELEELFEYASKVGVTPEEDPYYGAVNGGNAGYAELVAEALGLSNFDVTTWGDLDYDALAKAGLITVGFDENELSAFAISQLLGYVNDYIDEDVRASVNDYADVVLATLIDSLPPYVDPSVILGDLDFSTPINGAIDELVNFYLIADRDVAEMDWAALVGEENVGYVDAIRAELAAQIRATGIMETYEYKINIVDIIFDNKDSFGDSFGTIFEMFNKEGFKEVLGENQYYTLQIPVVDTLVFAAESYLYSFVEFSVEYANLVEYVLVNNPEAAVVLLGAYNAFDMDFDLMGYSVNLGYAYDYIAKLASVQPKAYAFVVPNVGYADISDAQTLYNEYVELEIFSNSIEEFLLWYLLDDTLTDVSEAGNYYIYEQIMNALVILEPATHEHVYDNDCDCYCNICGEYRVVEHVYDNDCDRYCNVCNEYRITSHVYDDACDAICNVCGAARVPADHVYDNACDADCNVCGDVREVSGHTYDNACDADCNVCGAIRVPGVHKYDNACDADCNVCGATRVPADHVYDNACDADCNVCGATRTPAEHVYDNACDKDCNVCGDTRTTSHKYDNACDKTCNVCGATRTVADHVYDNACDATCNVCGATRTVADHVDANNDGKCDACGAEVAVNKTEEPEKDGLGAGAIIAIILGSTVGASAAGGSVFWFVIKKKSFAYLLNLVKGLAK